MMRDRLDRLRQGITRPLPLDYHPLYRFYEGGSLSRAFRGLPERGDDFWSEDWVGSCTCANNADPDGRNQGLSSIRLPDAGAVTLKELVEALPEEMVGARFAEQWGTTTGVLVKLLSPKGPVPVHAHPTREWAQRHLGSRFGKTEAWILLDTPGDSSEPAHAGIGFTPGIDRASFADAVMRHDNRSIREAIHRIDVHPDEVYVAHAGVPHYLGPRLSFIEIQEPSDHIVIAETSGNDDGSSTMGLSWDLALDMIDYTGADAQTTLARARQTPRVLRTSRGSREVRLVEDDVVQFFDATALEVPDDIEVDDGRFWIAIVVSGAGSMEGNFGTTPIQRGDTLAIPASLAIRVRAGREPVRVIRCLGPAITDPAFLPWKPR
jgi:mannose-6-phosphate isomerase